jgi:hypothetical protein
MKERETEIIYIISSVGLKGDASYKEGMRRECMNLVCCSCTEELKKATRVCKVGCDGRKPLSHSKRQ